MSLEQHPPSDLKTWTAGIKCSCQVLAFISSCRYANVIRKTINFSLYKNCILVRFFFSRSRFPKSSRKAGISLPFEEHYSLFTIVNYFVLRSKKLNSIFLKLFHLVNCRDFRDFAVTSNPLVPSGKIVRKKTLYLHNLCSRVRLLLCTLYV
jgi:hypothetical protein